jgi:dolichol kinase
MINFSNIKKTAAASIGALLVSTLFVVAAVGPVNPAAASSTASISVQAQA